MKVPWKVKEAVRTRKRQLESDIERFEQTVRNLEHDLFSVKSQISSSKTEIKELDEFMEEVEK